MTQKSSSYRIVPAKDTEEKMGVTQGLSQRTYLNFALQNHCLYIVQDISRGLVA